MVIRYYTSVSGLSIMAGTIMNKDSKNSQHHSHEAHSNKVHHDMSRNNTFSHAHEEEGEEKKHSVESVFQNSSQEGQSAQDVHHNGSHSLQDSHEKAFHEEVIVDTSDQVQELERSVEELKKKW